MRTEGVLCAILLLLAADKAYAKVPAYLSSIDSSADATSLWGSANDNPTLVKAGGILGRVSDVGQFLFADGQYARLASGAEIAAEGIAGFAVKRSLAQVPAIGGIIGQYASSKAGKFIRRLADPVLNSIKEEERIRKEGDENYRLAEENTRRATSSGIAPGEFQRQMQIGNRARSTEEFGSGENALTPKTPASPSTPFLETQTIHPSSPVAQNGAPPTWTGVTHDNPSAPIQHRGVPQRVLTPPAKTSAVTSNLRQSSRPNGSEANSASNVSGVNTGASGCSGASASVGGVHCGSSRPVVSATPLEQGGVRVAPSLPSDRKDGRTSPKTKGDLSLSHDLPKTQPTGGGTQATPPWNSAAMTAPTKPLATTSPATASKLGTSRFSGSGSSGSVAQVATAPAFGAPVAKPPGSGSFNVAVAKPGNNSMPSSAPGSGPGGISLSKAAADKLNLNLDFEGAFFADGKIVLSGRPQPGGIDAAILLTSLRLACEPGDPFFSLDPDDGKAWSDDGEKLANIVSDKIIAREKLGSGRNRSQGLTVRVFSARRDYAQQWPKLLSEHPDFKTRLVFRPEWLAQTRFGEILYKADVLLKELSAGAPIILPEAKLRAATVDGYVPSNTRSAARSLLELVERNGEAGNRATWRGHRLWFDLVADIGTAGKPPGGPGEGFVTPRTAAGNALFQQLKQRDIVSNAPALLTKASQIVENGNTFDLSQVYPQMFVRLHDHGSGKDLPGSDFDLDVLSADVNQRPERYAAAYKELRDLTDSFRAYILASKYVKRFPKICSELQTIPLIGAEKTEQPLPEHRPSDLFLTLVAYNTSRQYAYVSGRSVSGGISVRGKLFADQRTTRGTTTPVTLELGREVASNNQHSVWQASSGRHFVALKVGPGDLDIPTPAKPEPVATSVPDGSPSLSGKSTAKPSVYIPAVSATIGRFEIFEGARISGDKLKSSALISRYTNAPKAAMEECAQVCSADSNCIAFEIDQANDRCQTYSTVRKAQSEQKWMHGVWK